MEEELKFLVEANEGDEEEAYENESFYENIEAPKFVDLAAPDRSLPANDRYWFCSRVGCDQKHEEEMDSEEIYKRFVLRVMAARSPNVRLRKALYRTDSSSSGLKCPKTVPPKPRVSRLALISSISKRFVDPSRNVGTASPKIKQSSVVSKALTTPRNKKQLSNLDAFRSVRNPKGTSNAMTSNKVVAKALVFGSPRKAGKAKTTMELKTPVKDLCTAMKKLEIGSRKKPVLGGNRPPPSNAKRKLLRGREVKSRVYDGLCSKNREGGVEEEAKTLKCLKKRNAGKSLHHIVENNSSVNEIAKKSDDDDDQGNANLEGPSEDGVSIPSQTEDAVDEASQLDSSRSASNSSTTSQDSKADQDTTGRGVKEEKIGSSPEKKESNHGTENDLSLDGKDESDDKENESASGNKNREFEDHSSNMENKAQGKHQGLKENPKMQRAKLRGGTIPKKTSATAATIPEELKQRKPKLTNPKPFRLRTDERRILKEAILETKLPEKETASATPDRHAHGAGKHQTKLLQEGASQFHVLKEKVGKVMSTTPQRHTVSSQQKLVVAAAKSDKVAPKLRNSSKKGRPQVVKRFAKSPLATPVTAETPPSMVTPGRLGVIRETSPTISGPKEEGPKLAQAVASPSIASMVTPGRLGVIRETSPTISGPKEEGPKLAQAVASPSIASNPLLKLKCHRINNAREPKFHPMHTPKSCTWKLA